MKNLIKKIILFCITSSLICTCCVAHADSTPLYEKYGYREDFEYEDEMIAHALKSTVVLIVSEYTAEATYTPIVLDTYEIQDLIDNNPQATNDEFVEYIIDYYSSFTTQDKSKSVPVTVAGRGSGVVISEDGYIATNSHVVSFITDDIKTQYTAQYISDAMEEDLDAIDDAAQDCGLYLSEEHLESFQNIMLDTIKVKNKNEAIYVCFPSASGKTNIKKSRVFEAEIVEEGTSATEQSADGLTQDVAIIKTDLEDLVALSLSDEYPQANSNIVSAGFPAVANEIFDAIGDESTLSVTIGTGKVSRQISIKGTDYKAMEITTTISNGSSGGPSVDDTLKIEGLNTYVHNEDKRFAYMIPAEYINDLTEDYDLEQGEVSKTFLTGLQMLQEGYGLAAVECFKEVQYLQADVPYITTLIDLAEKAPAQYPPDMEQTGNAGYQLIYIIAGAAGVVLILIIVLIIIIAKKRRKKKKSEQATASLDTAADILPEETPADMPAEPYTDALDATDNTLGTTIDS